MENTILVVDDSPFMVRTLSFILEKAGYTVATAGSGTEALAQARATQPRLILLDSVMPGMDGRQVLESIRQDPSLQKARVVMVSGSDADDLPEADGFVAKPFTPDKVLETVARLIEAGS